MAKYYIGQISPKEILKYFKLNEIENTTHQNVWSATKEVLWGKIKAFNRSFTKEKSTINNLIFFLKKLEK